MTSSGDPPPAAGTPSHHGARLDLASTMSYGDYLRLEAVLGAQSPLSDSHDEMLFIVQHQTSELWMKLVLHELRAAVAAIAEDRLPPAFKMLARVSRVMEQLVHAWDVLSTLTPSEYTAMRAKLGSSSGFQSFQYREIEFMLGNKNPVMLRPHAHQPHRYAQVEAALHAPSLYDVSIRQLARRGFAIDPDQVTRDWAAPRPFSDSVEAAWLTVYREPSAHWELYELAEELVDLEDAFRQWRYRHVTTVERIIGFKPGTGGTNGVPYLRRMLETVLFPELWKVRTDL